MTLADLKPEQSGTVREVDMTSPDAVRLMELGIVPGTSVRVVRFAPLGDPMEIEARGYNLSLRRAEATAISIELS
ncbi:MAG TPA: FeoA family protein [Abditibacteriaceae bacterium]|jgi:Fe2+ transport system protein FeoA